MDPRVLKTLEFDKIRDGVTAHCTSVLGRSRISELVPSGDMAEVKALLEETDEALAIYRIRGNVPMGGLFDIRPYAKRAQAGGVLGAVELMETASSIRAGRILRQFLEAIGEDGEIDIPLFLAKKEEMPVLTALEHEINACIDDNGKVVDSASSALRSIRQQLRAQEGRVRDKLEQYTRNNAKMLSDSIVTIRNDRYVIPVKQEYRTHFGGIVHDQSSSGQTLFIEPDAVVQANNEIRRLKMKEHEEIERILRMLSEQVQGHSHELFILIRILGDMDAVLAKAKYGMAEKATIPSVNNDGYIRLVKARHPLIPREEAVTNTIEFGRETTAIVITGPNTGGKTVTLKTVGLCMLMAQAGLPIPVLEGSETAVFDKVFADIGDEQSIEQSLSTFSSHMVNIVGILERFDERSLVLFDELGSGTDPQEGAALAISILDEVHGRGARVMATTHYPELKAYGYNRPGVVNASVEFDVETLSPTYRLLIGVPGRSNAFEISQRLGLPEHIIRHAKTFTGENRHEVETMITSLEASRVQAEKDAEETARVRRESEALRSDLETRLSQYEAKKESLEEKAREKAKKIVEDARREAESVISELRAMRLNAGAQVKEHELIEAKKRLEGAAPAEPLHKKAKGKAKSLKHELQSGDEVKVISYGQKGTLIEKAADGEWLVQIGILKMRIHETDLQWVKPEKAKETVTVTNVRGRSGDGVKLELDLRGERYEEAIRQTEKYIDDALLSNYPRVSIIHGKGTGALREGIQKYLRRHPRVKSYRFGEAGEGGYGVTIVELK